MADDPRYDAATAVTGAALLGGGGALRHHAVRRAYPKGRQPKIHALSMMRKAPKGKKQFWAGSAIGALGLPPLALGTTRLARGDVDKADDQRKPGFWREGLRGTKEALGQRADSYRQPVPTKLRAAQLGVGAATGAVGSVVARAALGRRGDALKPFVTPIAGGLAATGSVPLTNRAVHARYPDYEVTPSGVRRKKKPIVMPSKMASRHRGTPRSLRQDVGKAQAQAIVAKADETKISHPGDGLEMQQHLEEHHGLHWKTARDLDARGWTSAAWREYHEGSHLSGRDVMRQPLRHTHPHLRIVKADSYLGARTPYATQRAVTTASTHTPVVGPFVSAGTAARYAPPGQGRKAAARQWAMSSGVGIPAGVAGAYGGAYLANRSDKAHHAAQTLVHTKDKVEGKARSMVGLKDKGGKGPVGRGVERFVRTKAGKPFRTPRGAIGGAAGMVVARGIAGGIGDQAAITMNQNAQRRYNKVHHIEKAVPRRQWTDRERAIVLGQHLQPLPDKPANLRRATVVVGQEADKHGSLSYGRVNDRVGRESWRSVHRGESRQYEEYSRRVRSRGARLLGSYETRKLGGGPGGRQEHAVAMLSRYRPLHERKRVLAGGALALGGVALAARKHHKRDVAKAVPTKREKHDLATQKRRTAALSTASGLLGLGSLGLIATGRRNAAVTTGILGSGIGGTNSLLGARVQRKEAQNVDPVKKAFIPGTGHWDIPKNGLVQMVGSGGKWASAFKDRTNPLLGVRYVDPEDVLDQDWTRARLKAHAPFKPNRQKVRARATDPKLVYQFRKAAALEIKGSDRDHHDMIRRYGDRGPLPKGLSREDRMKAYEARYVHHGGDKANKWSRHAATGESLKNAGLGVATAGGAAWLATRGKRGARLLAKRPNLARHAETTAVAGATVGGAGEMLAGYAHRRQSSYANSPGGVAASALRRMRAYTPETT